MARSVLRERFSRPLDPRAAALAESTREDRRILPHDLWGSLAHARMLGASGIIPRSSARRIETGLRAISAQVERGRFHLDANLEDVHLNVEVALGRRIGRDGGRLHTARSRNDQVATDLALYLRDALLALEVAALDLARTLLDRSASSAGRTVVAGWTHLQPAQRLYWGQVLATHALRMLRDAARFRSIRERLTESPLGSGAIAGTSLPIDRALTARLLGFERPGPSSLDGVSDRDAAVETLGALALFSIHGSSLAEELVLGSMPEVDRVRLDDAYVTTSSLMPHKRNPDLAELARAAAGPAVGRLVAHLTILKALPIGYQRDLQAGKPLLFDGIEDALAHARVLGGMVGTVELREGPSTVTGGTGSVELADALVATGMPFRTAHTKVARLVRRLEPSGRPLESLSRAELVKEFPTLAARGFRFPPPQKEPEQRRSTGGSSWKEVRALTAIGRRDERTARKKAVREYQRLARLRRVLGAPPSPFG
ncbi:MAG TPA: argininosuccinate lyase [Thermoplasmata archaeon]|nr:argininosuccinate lyase [Thermoplasmata archaeon]